MYLGVRLKLMRTRELFETALMRSSNDHLMLLLDLISKRRLLIKFGCNSKKVNATARSFDATA